MIKLLKGFEPIVGDEPRILILGSMPSVVSLEKQQYYGFKHNRFWKIISSYFDIDFNNYEEKKKCIVENHIALWDTIESCEREGSLDSKIKNVKCNDIEWIINKYPSIKLIVCNGQKSYSLFVRYFSNLGVKYIGLPSTSNANRTIKESELYQKWYTIFDNYL